MSITQATCTSFKAEVLLGAHDLRNDTIKIALYSSTADINANTTAYTTTGEVTGTNYSAGGVTLTFASVAASNSNAASGVGYVDFENATFSNVTVTARGALIYNSTPSANGVSDTTLTNAAICVLDFGEDKVATAQDFTVTFPAGDATNAIVKIK